MPESKILRGRKTFKDFFYKSQRINSQLLDIVFKESESTEIAIIAKKKIIPLASHRNYAKRLIKEIVRKEILPTLNRSFKLVFIPNKDFLSIEKKLRYKVISEEITKLLKSRKLLNEGQTEKTNS